MNVTILLDADRLLLAGYILAVVCLNATMYLISSFFVSGRVKLPPFVFCRFSRVTPVACSAVHAS